MGIRTVDEERTLTSMLVSDEPSRSEDQNSAMSLESDQAGRQEIRVRPPNLDELDETERATFEQAIRQDERRRVMTRLQNRRTEAIEEARRAWTALARREDVLRGLIATHYRILGRSDIMYDPWREGRDSTPPLSQAELRDMRARIEDTILRQVLECDRLMSWEHFNEVIQCYDYTITQG
jgi:hypothetical protein